ncbi:MAG TPA: methyltransferase domain-containing protein [Candidatus Omnitrophota bacterium]|nr:methyltransferase domain-containing protein [Candidatus Omnitrophota bacterium]
MKFKYFINSLIKRIQRKELYCPSCGCTNSISVDRKFWVTTLQRCAGCSLLFRQPFSTNIENKSYYQTEYREGFTTSMPSVLELENLKSVFFQNTPKDFKFVISIFKALGFKSNQKICDFGCSWGYGSWQFSQAGFDVVAFEVSEPRAAYAKEKLNVLVTSRAVDIRKDNDIFFSSHVLEHLPKLEPVLNEAINSIVVGGVFIALTPNGSFSRRKKEPYWWSKAWGLKHPNFLDEIFYKNRFKAYPYFIVSSPYNLDMIMNWASFPSQFIGNLDGEELLIIVKKVPF